MKRLGALLACVGLSLLVSALAPQVSAQQGRPAAPHEVTAAWAAPALVYVETFWEGVVSDEAGTKFNDGQPLEFSSSCTGFVVNPAGAIVTAGHCVDDSASFGGIKRDMIEIAAREAFEEGRYEGAPSLEELRAFGLANWSVEGPTEGSPVRREVFVQRGRAVPGERSGRAVRARVMDFRSAEAGDVALLDVESGDLPAVVVSDSTEPVVGSPIVSLGYPGQPEGAGDEALKAAAETGTVTGKKSSGPHLVYEVSAAIASGMSGGPSVDADGEVVGVNSFGVGDSEAFNFIVPAGNIREILASNGVANELGRSDAIYRRGLTAFYAADYASAIGAFNQVLDLDPAHEQAKEYIRRAGGQVDDREVGPLSQGADRELPFVPVAIGAVVLAGLTGAALALKNRTKPEH